MPTRIAKAFRALTGMTAKASRGTVGSYVTGTDPSYGQPYIAQVGDATSLITPERMREIVLKTPTPAACMNVILDYAITVALDVRNKDASKPVPTTRRERLEDFLARPNPQEDWQTFATKLYRDITVLGFGALEIERNATGGVANLWVLDAARVRIAFDEHGTVQGYNMLDIRGKPILGKDGVHAWSPDDIIYFQRDAQSHSAYSLARFSQLFACAVLESLMMQFIGNRFTESNVPYGVLDMGDITETEIKSAIALWNQQMQQLGQNKLMLTGSRGGMHFIPFADPLDKMHAKELLREVRGQIMSILGVTVNELGEAQDVNKSNGFNLSYTFKKRAIEPLLSGVASALTQRLLWDEMGYKELELYYQEIDSRDELLQGQIDKLYLDTGIWSINHVRNRKGLPNVQGGEEPFVILGTNAVPVSMLQAFAQAQLDAVQAEVLALQVQVQQAQLGDPAAAGALAKTGSPPVIRGPQNPEKFTTPGGAGSSTPKFKLPQAQPAGTASPRGPVQAGNTVGMRAEHTKGQSS